MRNIRGSFCKTLEERIVVLRHRPQNLQDESVAGELLFCNCPYPRKAFDVIITEASNQRIAILRRGLTVDADGFVVAEEEYRGNLTPPNPKLQVGDLVLRMDRNCEELYIYGITEVAGIQQLVLENRSKTGDA